MPNDEPVHKYDVFAEGDEIPWFNQIAEIRHREVVSEKPDVDENWEAPDYTPPEQDGTDYVVLTVLKPDDEFMTVTASALYRQVSEKYNTFGHPSVSSSLMSGVGSASAVEVNVPATGARRLSREQALDLADTIREHAMDESFYVLIGRTETPQEAHDLADALERAALVMEYVESQEEN